MPKTIRERVTSSLLRLNRRVTGDLPLRVANVVAGKNPRAQSRVFFQAIRHHDVTRPAIAAIAATADRQSFRGITQPLSVRMKREDLAFLDHLKAAVRSEVPALEYMSAMLQRRYVDAFDIWQENADVDRFLALFSFPPVADLTRTLALVLPGSTTGNFGPEIDAHDLVARTALFTPSDDEAARIGSRTDIAFLNNARYEDLCQLTAPEPIAAELIIVGGRIQTLRPPPWLEVPVRSELTGTPTPTTGYTLMPLRAVPWCLARGLRPTLYFADFYLGDDIYQSTVYDPRRRLDDVTKIARSYAEHDVFFAHVALKAWRASGHIATRGRLDELLDWDGRALATAMQERWGDSG